MIKILFYSHTIDFAGTWRSHERILLNIDRNKFDPYVFYNPNADNNRLDYLSKHLDASRIIPYTASEDRLSPSEGYAFRENNFNEVVKSFNFDIIHFARSGYYEWPFISRISPIQIETNIFGYRDVSSYLDYSVSICNRIRDIRGGSDEVVYNPIPLPFADNHNLKNELNIPEGYHIFGRIGRKAHFYPISFIALRKLKDIGYKFKYIIIGACQKALSIISQLDLVEDCIIIETTNDDYFIHKFYNTIDLFLHYREDGECHSTAIAQSLIYGKPVISHFAGYNGQSETISCGGKVCSSEDEYFQYLKFIIDNRSFYDMVSKYAVSRGMDFEQSKIVKKWEEIYLKLYNKKTSN